MVDFAIDGLDEMVAFAIDGLGMTWQLHIKTRTKVRVFRAKKYLLKVQLYLLFQLENGQKTIYKCTILTKLCTG